MSNGERGQPRVVVTVGTDVHPFDRLVGWIDSWALHRGAVDEVFVQYGTSSPPVIVPGAAYLDHDRLVHLVAGADAVVTHGGPATIMEVRQHHGRPIVVPRDPARGEHVDRHQMEFAAAMARQGVVEVADDDSEFERLLTEHLASPPRPAGARPEVVPDGIVNFARLVDLLLSGNSRRAQRVTR